MFRRGVFLTAAWRHLVVLNFSIDPALLKHHVPPGVELDLYHGQCFVSIVGFSFQKSAILGMPAVGHRNFVEVNLRFYVRRNVDGQWRRGVVFIQEIVPRRAVAWIARTLYSENYITRPMESHVELIPELSWPRMAEYRWKIAGTWNRVGIRCLDREPAIPKRETLEEFIIEHYWGYSTDRRGHAREYQVEHPRWQVLGAQNFSWDVNAVRSFGEIFGPALTTPHSAFLALGSEIAIRWGTKL